jgi:hypothetical protein
MTLQTIAAYDGTTDSANIQLLARGTASADIIANGVTCAVSDTFSIDVEGNDDVIIAIYAYNSGASAVTFDAGDNPPSPRAGLGSHVETVPDGDLVLFTPEAGRHIQSDGTITGSVATTACKLWVFRAGAGFLGIEITNRATIPSAPTD